jgi:hypothetical protein
MARPLPGVDRAVYQQRRCVNVPYVDPVDFLRLETNLVDIYEPLEGSTATT